MAIDFIPDRRTTPSRLLLPELLNSAFKPCGIFLPFFFFAVQGPLLARLTA